MIHLHAAQLLREGRGALFCLGAVAPDAIEDWRVKDRTHLRDVPDRAAALAEIARETDPRDDFAEGVLLHLYADWLWDKEQLERYWASLGGRPEGGEWVPAYRREISLASGWIYRHSPWARPLWEALLAIPREQYGPLPGMDGDDIRAYLTRNFKWHEEHKGPPSAFYPPEEAEAFVVGAAEGYGKWRGTSSVSPRLTAPSKELGDFQPPVELYGRISTSA